MKSKKIRPLHDRVIVKRLPQETQSHGGIIIPDTAKEKPVYGSVSAVGPGRRNDKGELVSMDVKVGEVVLFGKYAGTEIVVDGEEHLILREEEILGVVG